MTSQHVYICGSGDGFVPNRRQAINLTNEDFSIGQKSVIFVSNEAYFNLSWNIFENSKISAILTRVNEILWTLDISRSYNAMIHTKQQLQWFDFGQTLHSRTAPQSSPSQASYGVSFVKYSKKYDRDISRAHCIHHSTYRVEALLQKQRERRLQHTRPKERTSSSSLSGYRTRPVATTAL